MVEPIDIWAQVPTPALYEQLAEECSELAHAALKVARISRGENPTPADIVEASHNVVEELTDIKLVADVIGIGADNDILQKKLERWNNRIQEAKRNAKMG